MAVKTFQEHTATDGNYLFSTAANWGGTIPVIGDTLIIQLGLTCTYDLIAPAAPSISLAAATGGCVVTISGAAGATHYLLYRGNHTAWQAGGNRSGNGTITVTGLSNDVEYVFTAYSVLSDLISIPSLAAALTLSEVTENNFDETLEDESELWLDEFSETIHYLPGSGGTRIIQAIVNRNGLTKPSGLPYGVGSELTIEVANSATLGISAAELDCGRDCVNIAEHPGGSITTKKRITRIIGQDAGMIRMELH